MKRIALLGSALAIMVGCGGAYVGTGEVSSAYVEEPGIHIETAPRHRWHNEYVYEHNNGYYRHYRNHWYRFRERPHDLDIHVR